jgi:hypothetical protein
VKKDTKWIDGKQVNRELAHSDQPYCTRPLNTNIINIGYCSWLVFNYEMFLQFSPALCPLLLWRIHHDGISETDELLHDWLNQAKPPA